MIKSSLVKGLVFGLCLSALSTSAVFASVAGEAIGFEGKTITVAEEKLFTLQKEIDQILFVDNFKEIEKQGFMVNYTGVAENYVEVGISPYSDKNADYLYQLLGEDQIKVVEFDQSIIYATSGPVDAVAEDVPVTDEDAPDKEQIYTTMDVGTTEPEVIGEGEDAVIEDRVYKGNDAAAVAEEDMAEDSVEDSAQQGAEPILYTTTADGDEVQVLAEAEAFDAVKRGEADDAAAAEDGVNAPVMVLVIAGSAALIGGTILIEKKKTSKK